MAEIEVLGLYPDDPSSGKARAKAAQTGDTYTMLRALSVAGEALTGAAATSLLDLSQTWDTTGTPTLIKANVTDTASNAASLLMDLQVGGSSKFKVDKSGNITWGAADGTISNPATFVLKAGSHEWTFASTDASFRAAGDIRLMSSTAAVRWVSDLYLYRDAANILAQRNGVNAQASRIYNTYTDASNYERLSIGWSGNVMTIGTEAAGTGTQRNVVLNGANRATYSEVAADIAAALVSHGIMSPA